MKKEPIKQNHPTKPSIKFVKKANMFCKTYWLGDKQIQEWSINKPK